MKINLSMKYKCNEHIVWGFLFLLFFCNKVFESFIARTLGNEHINIVYCIVFFSLLMVYLIYHLNDMIGPVFIYILITCLFLATYLIHPEYSDWFHHSLYGIVPAFLNPRGGIWALLIVWLGVMNDEREVFKYLKIAAWILFVYLSLKFFAAQSRGYWITYDVSGEMEQGIYSLEFGYDMVFPVVFMGAYACLSKRKIYYIPFLAGFLMIIMGGSRGAIIGPTIMFPLMIPFKCKSLGKEKCIMILMFLIPVALLIYNYFDTLMEGLFVVLDQSGVSSRTIVSLLTGTFTDGNGREKIYEMALERIREGGLFGWGVYGDRYVIGEEFSWGYSHNLFLELFVTFGYLGGIILSVYLVFKIFSLYHKCKDLNRQVIFMTFFCVSLKLMLSNSFWYTAAFWALIAIMLRWCPGKRSILMGKRMVWA